MKRSKVSIMLAICIIASCISTIHQIPCVYAEPVSYAVQSNTVNDKVYYSETQILELLEGINSIEDIETSSYIEKPSMNVQDFITGDIMTIDDTAYIYIEKEVKPNKWMKIIFPTIKEDGEEEDDSGETLEDTRSQREITLEETEISYGETARFFRWVKQSPVYEVPEGLEGVYGDSLSTITLPSAYKWVNDSIKMQSVGDWGYAAIYTPENTLKYNEATVILKVKVNKKSATVESPRASYTLTYFPGLTLDYISLPTGWRFVDTNEILDVGIKKYKAVFDGDPNYAYTGAIEKDITITVKKGSYNITGAVITVIQGTLLVDDLLPEYSNGQLVWDSQGITAFETGRYACTFYPYDTQHYDPTSGIWVQVNVIPRSSSNTGADDDDLDGEPDYEPDDNHIDKDNGNNKPSGNKDKDKNKDKNDNSSSNSSNNSASSETTNNNSNTNSGTNTDKNITNTVQDEEEEQIDVSTVTNITDDDIKTTERDETSKKKNTKVNDLKVTKTEKEEQDNSKLVNIDLVQAAPRTQDGTTEATDSDKTNKKNETYKEDPTVDSQYKVDELQPEDAEETSADEQKVTVTYTDDGAEQDSIQGKIVVVLISVLASAIGIATYFILKKRKLSKR